MEGLSQTEYDVRRNRDMRFSHEGYDTNCLLGYDAVSHDTNLERGGRQIPAWCDLPDDRNYEASLCQLAFCFVTRYILW